MAFKFPDILKHKNVNRAIADTLDLSGGHHSVANTAARNAIPLDKRQLRMLVSYNNGASEVTKKFLGGDISDLYWTDDLYWEDIVSSSGSVDTTAIHKITPAEISTLVEKSAIVNDDILLGEDSESSPTAFTKIKIKISSILTSAATYVDALISYIVGFTTTATAAGTTVLTVSSTANQFFTGATTQIINLPVTTTLTNGRTFYFKNNSTGNITVRLSDGSYNLVILKPKQYAIVKCIDNTSNVITSWNIELHNFQFVEVVLGGVNIDIVANLGIAGFVVPTQFVAIDAYVYAETAGTGSSTIYDINNSVGTSILSTKIINSDGGNKSASGVFSTSVFTDNYQYFSIDCDQNGATSTEQNTFLIFEYYEYQTPAVP